MQVSPIDKFNKLCLQLKEAKDFVPKGDNLSREFKVKGEDRTFVENVLGNFLTFGCRCEMNLLVIPNRSGKK
jgi:hypothetical protein